jgi:hypothetical protein
MATSFVFFIGDLYNPFFCSTLSEFENFLLCERILINVQLVKTKRQANFTDFKRFGALKGLVEQKKLVFCPTGFRIPGYLATNINIKITIYSPLYSSRSLFFIPSSLFFHPSPCRLRSIFLPITFSFSLSFRRMCSIFSLSSRHLLHLLSLFSFLPIPVLSLSLSLSPPLQPAIIFLSHTHSLPSLLYFDSLILSLLPYLSVSLSLYLFIHLLFANFLAGSSSFSLLLLENFLQFLLSLIPFKPVPVYLYFPVSYCHPFSSISLFSGQLS